MIVNAAMFAVELYAGAAADSHALKQIIRQARGELGQVRYPHLHPAE